MLYKKFIKNAPYLVKFEVPRDAVLGAPSDLSKSEGELVGVNDLQGFGALLSGLHINPNLSDEQKKIAQKEFEAAMGVTST